MAIPLNQIVNMPNMSNTLNGWKNALTLFVVTQTIVNGFPTDSRVEFSFEGVVQPLAPEAIKLKPEGQRSWNWLQIHVTSGDLDLKNNDIIEFNNVQFKVMAKKDYALNGYIEYHVVKDFT